MNRKLLKSKIHRATVTDANLEYEGSVTLDGSLMEGANIKEYEHVCIWNLNSGARVETYAIVGKLNSGTVCINGAAAHHIKAGDKVIIASYGYYPEEEAKNHQPILLLVDDQNRPKRGES
jgi:aspartate 1-decarboxylase